MLFLNAVSAIGLSIFAYCLARMAIDKLSLEWILLSVVTVVVVSRTDIQIPKTSSTVTLDDTFIYLSMLLYGVSPAVVLAGINAAVCSLHYANKGKVARFNAAVMSLSVFVAGNVIEYLFGEVQLLSQDWSRLVLAAETLALIHYAINSGLVNIVAALRRKTQVFHTWRESFLWTSVSYFAGAVAACLVVKLVEVVSFFSFIIVVPILAITYLTYKNYIDKVRLSISHAEEMADLHLRTIEALAIAIDAKDEVTHEHVGRVQVYASGMAKIFGLSESEVAALKAGALLHDIGKLAVPDYILNKPGKLTPAEFEKMKVHTIVGSEILERVNFPYPVAAVVRHHHERWDGRGYPDGLRGDEIPLTARILAVVDCFDAAREDRQYRKALARDEAVRLLEESSGSTYDPQVVRAFLEHLPDFEQRIKELNLEHRDRRKEHLRAEARESRPAKSTAFESIRNAHREVITLYNIAQTIGTSLDLRDTFAVFSARLQDIVSYTTCVLYLKSESSGDLEVAHVSGLNAEVFKGRRLTAGTGITGWVTAHGKAMCNADPRLDITALKLDVGEKYQAAMAVPLMKDTEIFGALTLYAQEAASYAPDHLRLVEAVAKLASDAIANALRHKQTETNALTDALTDLPNARALRRRFEEVVSQSQNYGTSFAVLMMDLDGFKKINDTRGHQAGDEVLKELAGLLKDQFRTVDFLCRYAGDEFVALLEATPEEVQPVIRRLQQVIDRHIFVLSQTTEAVGLSIGYACFGIDGDTLDELLLLADRGMYWDKSKRKSLAKEAADGQAEGDVPDVKLSSHHLM